MAVQQPQTPYLQIIRNTALRLLLAVVTLLAATLPTACSKQDPDPQIRISVQEILLPGDASGNATFTVTADAAWGLTYSGEGFSVSPSSGTAGETTVTVTPTEANTEKERRQLGTITIHFFAGKQDYGIPVSQRPATASRTVLLYMPGRDLITFYKENIAKIQEAITAEIPGDGRMLVCYQPRQHATAEMLELRYDPSTGTCESIPLTTYEDFNAGRPEDVQQVFTDAAAYAPAERYGLIIGCHGKAWIPASSGVLPRSVRPGGPTDVWTPVSGALPTRSFGDTGHELDIAELAAILEVIPLRFDYLVFDDCFMASIETLYDLRTAVDYVVASPCEIMAAGFPYDRIIPHLFDEEADLRTQLNEICREFWYFYQYDWDTISGNEQSGCISLAVMSELDALAAEMRRVSSAAKQDFERAELQYYKGGNTKLFYDLGQFVALSCGDAGVADAFAAQMERAFPTGQRYHTPNYYSAYNGLLNPISYYTGVTTSEPETTEPYATDCRQTAWYRATH